MEEKASARTGAIVLVVSLACVFALLEWASRTLSPDRFYVWPPNFEHTFDPDPGIVHGVTFPSQLTINELGIRGAMPGDSKYHLLAIGGSTTICAMLDDRKTWPWRLQEHLNASLGEGAAWVGNVGRPGHTTAQHILQAEELLKQHDFVDAILLMVGANDLMIMLALAGMELAPQTSDAGAGTEQEALAIAFALTPDSEDQLPWYLRNFIGRTARRLRWSPIELSANLPPMDSAGNFLNTVRGHRERASTFQDELPELRFARAAYRKRLEQLIDLGEAAGVEVIFLTQPAMWRAGLSEKEKSLLWMGGPPLTHLEDGASYFSAEALAEGLARFNETLLEVCRARDVECVDVAEVIPRNPQFFYDDAHYTEKGADLLAATVADQLLEGGTLSNLAKP